MKRKDLLWTLLVVTEIAIVVTAIAIVVYRWTDPTDLKYKTCEQRGGTPIEYGCIHEAQPDPRAAEFGKGASDRQPIRVALKRANG